MIKQIILLIHSQKKQSILLCILFFLSTTFLSLFFSLSESLKLTVEEHRYNQYGDYIAVVSDKEQIIDNSTYTMGDYGVIGLAINPNLPDSLTIGWMDEQAYEMRRVNWLEGRQPIEVNEVAVEAFVSRSFEPTWTLGEAKEFEVNGERLSLHLVGIMEDYSIGQSGFLDTIKGRNTFPNVTVSEAKTSLDSYVYTMIQTNQSLDLIFENSQLIEQGEADSFVNIALINGLQHHRGLNGLQSIGQWLILFFVCFALFTCSSFYKEQTNKERYLFKALGYTNTSIALIGTGKYILLYILGLFFSLPFIYLGLKAGGSMTYGNEAFFFDYGSVIKSFLFTLLPVTLLIGQYLIQLKNTAYQSVFVLMKKMEQKTTSSFKIEGKNFFFCHLLNQMDMHSKQFFMMVVLLAMMILSLFSFQFIDREEGENTLSIHDENFFVYISSFDFEIINDQYVYRSSPDYFPVEAVENFEQTDGVVSVNKVPLQEDLSIVIESQQIRQSLDSFSQQQINLDEGRSIIFSESSSSDNALVMNDFPMQWLSTEVFETLIGSSINDKTELENLVILYLPKASVDEQTALLYEDLMVRRIIKNDRDYNLQEWNYSIVHVLEEDTANLGLADQPVILFPLDGALSNQLVRGYSSFDVVLEKEMKHSEREIIMERLNDLVGFIPDTGYQDFEIETWESESLVRTMNLYFSSIRFLLIVYTMISVSIVLYGRFFTQSKTYGIYLVNGMTKQNIFLLFVCECFIEYGLAVVFASLGASIFVSFTFTTFPLFDYVVDFMLANSVVLGTITVSLFMFKRKINDFSILDMLRPEE